MVKGQVFGALIIVLQLCAGVGFIISGGLKTGLLSIAYGICNAILYFMN